MEKPHSNSHPICRARRTKDTGLSRGMEVGKEMGGFGFGYSLEEQCLSGSLGSIQSRAGGPGAPG